MIEVLVAKISYGGSTLQFSKVLTALIVLLYLRMQR